MARVGVVKFSALRGRRCWEAAHFLGNPKERQEAIDAAEKNLKNAQARLARAKQDAADEKARVMGFVKDGTVKLIAGGYADESESEVVHDVDHGVTDPDGHDAVIGLS